MTKDQLTALKRTVAWGDTWYDGWNAAIDRVITLSGEPPCANCARLTHDIEAGSAEIARLATRYAAAWRMLSALDSERLVPGILGSELRQFVQTNPPDVPLDSSGAVEPKARRYTGTRDQLGCTICKESVWNHICPHGPDVFDRYPAGTLFQLKEDGSVMALDIEGRTTQLRAALNRGLVSRMRKQCPRCRQNAAERIAPPDEIKRPDGIVVIASHYECEQCRWTWTENETLHETLWPAERGNGNEQRD